MKAMADRAERPRHKASITRDIKWLNFSVGLSPKFRRGGGYF
jgi:hypothetical protein